jgi:hypothetical protein
VVNSIKKLQSRRRARVDVFELVHPEGFEDFGPGDVVVEYMPSAAATLVQIKRIRKIGAEGVDVEEQFELSNDFLAELLFDWNITDDYGKPLPVTPDNVSRLPGDLQAAIIDAIFKHMQPEGNQTGSTSSTGSSEDQPKG